MNIESLTRFWPLIYSVVREFWEITEPYIEDAAVKNDVPIELYFYSELGLDYFSVEDFQKRDPFTNPLQFEKMFARFEIKDWIFPTHDERYQVSNKAREAVRMIVRAGNARLAGFDSIPGRELKHLEGLLRQLVTANLDAPEPPEKWAIIKRFRTADEQSSLIIHIKESLMDLFAYRDDSHLSAAHPYFGQAGIVWIVLGALWNRDALNAGQMVDAMAFRSYEEEDFEVAIQAAIEIGWVEAGETPNTYRPTKKGIEIREKVEKLTDEYFYRSWSVLTAEEIDELYTLLEKLRDQLIAFKRSITSDSHS
jgi:hypothetical protein